MNPHCNFGSAFSQKCLTWNQKHLKIAPIRQIVKDVVPGRARHTWQASYCGFCTKVSGSVSKMWERLVEKLKWCFLCDSPGQSSQGLTHTQSSPNNKVLTFCMIRVSYWKWSITIYSTITYNMRPHEAPTAMYLIQKSIYWEGLLTNSKALKKKKEKKTTNQFPSNPILQLFSQKCF